MKMIWFKRFWGGLCEVPITWHGWLITFIWAFINVWYFVGIDSKSHSGSDTLIGIAPVFIVTSTIYALVARFTDSKR